MAEDVRKTLGRRVRELRRHAGLTQEQLAEKAETDFQNIGRVERGESHIQINTLARIAEALEVTPAALLEPVGARRVQQRVRTSKDQLLEEMNELLVDESEDDIRLALEVVKTLVREKAGKRTGQRR